MRDAFADQDRVIHPGRPQDGAPRGTPQLSLVRSGPSQEPEETQYERVEGRPGHFVPKMLNQPPEQMPIDAEAVHGAIAAA